MCDRHCPGRKLASKEAMLSSLFYTTAGAIDAVIDTADNPDLVFRHTSSSTIYVYKYFDEPVGTSDTWYGNGEPCHYVVLIIKPEARRMNEWYIATAYPSYHVGYRTY